MLVPSRSFARPDSNGSESARLQLSPSSLARSNSLVQAVSIFLQLLDTPSRQPQRPSRPTHAPFVLIAAGTSHRPPRSTAGLQARRGARVGSTATMSAPDGPKPSLDASIGALCVPSPPRPHSLAPELTPSYATASCAFRQLLAQSLPGSDPFCNSGTVFSCFLAGVTFTQTLTYFSNFYRVDHLVLIVMTIALKTIGMAHTAICWRVLASSSRRRTRSTRLT